MQFMDQALMQKSKGADIILPSLNLGNIHVMGEITSRDPTQMKAYTKVELQVNMLKLYEFAYNKVEDWISDQKGDGKKVGFDDIADPTTSSG